MQEFWAEFIAFINAVIDGISTYVHSPIAIEINTDIAVMFKELADYCVYIIRDIMDIFGR